MTKKHIIIGTSAAGIGAAQKLRQLDQESEIICISDESEMPYNKCFIADYLAGRKTLQEVFTKKDDFFVKNNIQLMLNTSVIKIEPEKKNIILSDGTSLPYDTLFLGIGRKSPQLFKEQHELSGIFTFHALHSLLLLEKYIAQHKVDSVIIIGAGLSGLECADALQKYQLSMHIVDINDQVLAAQADVEGAKLLQETIKKASVPLHLQKTVRRIIQEKGVVAGVELSDGTILTAQMIIVAAGARINTQLAQDAGIFVDETTKAIITNEYLQTNVEHIYAGGDAILVYDQLQKKQVLSCLWPDAMLQGATAAHNMIGQKKSYSGTVLLVGSSFFGLQFASCGPIVHPPSEYEVILKQGDDFYHKYLLFENRLLGFLLLGKSFNLSHLKRAVLTQEQVNRDILL